MPKPPHNVAYLERAIRRLSDSNAGAVSVRSTLASVIAGQFLDGAVMRGGGSLKLRYGAETTRFTVDFDACRNVSEDEFAAAYARRLSEGWAGFSGWLAKRPKARPQGVPDAYVMQPFEVKLSYLDHPWCTVDFEVSYSEVGDADEAEIVPLPDDVKKLFSELGFPEPRSVPLMRIPHQIAQKLHGVTDRRSSRVQDLIDLQLIAARESVDWVEVNAICGRLFANRKLQPWPCRLAPSGEWRDAYGAMSRGMENLLSFDDAVKWADELIARISASGPSGPKSQDLVQ